MKKSGLADSPLFPTTPRQPAGTPLLLDKPSANKAPPRGETPPPVLAGTASPGPPTPAKPRDQATTQATAVSRYHTTIIKEVRRAVKPFGKEAATHRFTADEKKALAQVIYSYKSRGIRTSENEIARIAINFILADYRENRTASILDRALRALHT